MRHDMTSLRTQLDARLRRRTVLLWLLPVLLTCVVTATVVLTAQRPSIATRVPIPAQQPAAQAQAQAVVTTAAQPVDEGAATAAFVSSPMPTTSPQPPRGRHSKSSTKPAGRAVSPSPVPEPPAVAPTPAPSSRLRAQLDAMAEAHSALDAGEAERALSVLRALRETYPNGPIDLDAAVLIVHALLALDRVEEARSAVVQAHNHPHAAERRAALDRLQAELDDDDNDDNDNNGDVRP
jgi:hypothetical protein